MDKSRNDVDTPGHDASESAGFVLTGGGQVLPLRQAARVLGTSPDALRKRIERGKVQAHKDDGRWFVTVDLVDRNTRQQADKVADTRRRTMSSTDPVTELYERLLEEKEVRIRQIAELSESTRREMEEQYKEEITALQTRIRELEGRRWFRRKPRPDSSV